jgi:hypothetical protein
MLNYPNLVSGLNVEVPVDEEGLLVGASQQLPHEGGWQLQQCTVRQRLPDTTITPHYKLRVNFIDELTTG